MIGKSMENLNGSGPQQQACTESTHSMILRKHVSNGSPSPASSLDEKKQKRRKGSRKNSPKPPPLRKLRVSINSSWEPENYYTRAVEEWRNAGYTVRKYDLVASRRALKMRGGFRSEVTVRSPEQVVSDWIQRAATLFVSLPSRQEWLNGKKYGAGPLSSRYNLMNKEFEPPSRRPAGAISLPLQLLSHPDLGPMFLEILCSDGIKTIQQFAMSSRDHWRTACKTLRILNMVPTERQANGHSCVLLATEPEYTVDDFTIAGTVNPNGDKAAHSTSKGVKRPHGDQHFQKLLMDVATKRPINGCHVSSNGGKTTNRGKPQLSIPWKTSKVLGLISDGHNLWLREQVTGPEGMQSCRPTYLLQGLGLHSLMDYAFDTRNSLRVLHLHNIAFFDRRLLSILLRDCPNVRMVGVYDCPLIHYADVTSILDLINKVNCERRGKYVEIEAFDFFPHFQRGKPYRDDGYSGAMGLTWNPENLEVVQRGFYVILLKAFLKCKAMGLKLLFSKDHAFRSWMFQLPFTPLAIPTFLDALYRYVDLKGSPEVNNLMEALFDLLKPVTQGLPSMPISTMAWYPDEMGMQKFRCRCCGYRLLGEFFRSIEWSRLHEHRICSGCQLRRLLDEEEDHLKLMKKSIIEHLLENERCDGLKPDEEAPLHQAGRSIIHKETSSRGAKLPNSLNALFNTIEQAQDRCSFRLSELPTLAKLHQGDDSHLR